MLMHVPWHANACGQTHTALHCHVNQPHPNARTLTHTHTNKQTQTQFVPFDNVTTSEVESRSSHRISGRRPVSQPPPAMRTVSTPQSQSASVWPPTVADTFQRQTSVQAMPRPNMFSAVPAAPPPPPPEASLPMATLANNGSTKVGVGLVLRERSDGSHTVKRLKPGQAAEKSGQINPGDLRECVVTVPCGWGGGSVSCHHDHVFGKTACLCFSCIRRPGMCA
jgi:hypothetical protein